MGTNFYALSPTGEQHIGKRVAVGGGKCAFLWDATPGELERYLVFFNEYGEDLTREEITDIVLGCIEHDWSTVGTGFC